MADAFEGRDLAGATFWGVDLTGARFDDVDLSGAAIARARLVDVDIDGLVERVRINGVDVTDFVNERDPWHPLRTMTRPSTPDEIRTAWAAMRDAWEATIGRAEQLPEPKRHEQVDGEFSFVQTLQHLVFCMDKWFTVPVLGDERLDPIGLPNTGSLDFPWPGVDEGASPTHAEALSAWRTHAARVTEHLARLTDADLEGDVEVLENGTVPRLWCFHTICEESFEHDRYAERDLAALRAG